MTEKCGAWEWSLRRRPCRRWWQLCSCVGEQNVGLEISSQPSLPLLHLHSPTPLVDDNSFAKLSVLILRHSVRFINIINVQHQPSQNDDQTHRQHTEGGHTHWTWDFLQMRTHGQSMLTSVVANHHYLFMKTFEGFIGIKNLSFSSHLWETCV